MRLAPQPFTRNQKDGRACVGCRNEGGELVPDGHVYLPDLPAQGWAVVAHPTCRTTPEEES
ncbi:hypothetical protein [Kitasatospora purpeofusca]|uniref:hypothetical protein n=1 Tax=Kitasatospora purpeofusca TaxID=67352 RepID=UPI003664A59F